MIYAPNEVTFLNTTQCSGRTNLQGIQFCGLSGTNTMKVVLTFSGSIQPGAGFAFLLIGVRNPPSLAPSTRFRFETYTSDGYLISNITNGPTITNSKPSIMSSSTIRPSVYADG